MSGGVYFAKITQLLINKEKDPKCDKCVEPSRTSPSSVWLSCPHEENREVDKDFGEEYAGGKIMDPDNGKYYTCKIWIKATRSSVRGYIAFFYRTRDGIV